MRPDQLERRLWKRLDALGPAPRAELLHVLMLPDFERPERIGEFWGIRRRAPSPRLLIDCEEDRTLRAMLVGILREAERQRRRREARTDSGREGSGRSMRTSKESSPPTTPFQTR